MTRRERSPGLAGNTRLLELYDTLDRLEELIEDMVTLQVRSLEDAEARIIQIDAEMDEIERQEIEP